MVCALAVDGGHPGTIIHVLFAAGIYAVLRCATIPALQGSARARRLAWALGAIALGVLLLSVVTIPAMLAGAGSSGQIIRQGGGPTLPVSALRTVLFPDWWGRVFGGPLNYVERATFAGTIALLLGAIALSLRGNWRRKGPLTALGALGLGVPYGLPLLHGALTGLPLFNEVQDDRMVLLFMFAVSMLSAFGLQALIDGGPEVRRRCRWAIGLAVVAAAAALLSIRPGYGDLRTAVSQLLGASVEHSQVVWETTGPLWLLGMAGGLGLLLYGSTRSGRRLSPSVLAMLLTALAAVDMYHFAHGFQPVGLPSQVNPPSTPAVRFLQAHRSDGRVTGVEQALPVDWTMTYGLRDVRGYDPPQPSGRYLRLWRLANPAQGIGPLYLTGLDPRGVRVMSILGARYVIAGLTRPALENVEPEDRLLRLGRDRLRKRGRGPGGACPSPRSQRPRRAGERGGDSRTRLRSPPRCRGRGRRSQPARLG